MEAYQIREINFWLLSSKSGEEKRYEGSLVLRLLLLLFGGGGSKV